MIFINHPRIQSIFRDSVLFGLLLRVEKLTKFGVFQYLYRLVKELKWIFPNCVTIFGQDDAKKKHIFDFRMLYILYIAVNNIGRSSKRKSYLLYQCLIDPLLILLLLFIGFS